MARRSTQAHRRRARRAPPSRPRAAQAGRRAAADLRRVAALGTPAFPRRTRPALALQPAARRARQARRDASSRASRPGSISATASARARRRSASSPRCRSSSATAPPARRPARRSRCFKAVSVFDAQQVDPLPSGEPTPLQPPSQPLTGDSHAHLIAPTIAFAESLGYTVSFEPIAGSAGGWCDPKPKQIVIDSTAPPTRGCVRSSTRPSTPSESSTSSTRERRPKSSSTPHHWSCSAASAWTSPARPSPTWPAGARTARWTPSPSSPSSSTTLARRVETALSTAGDNQQTAAAA